MFQRSSERKMYVGDFFANNLSSLGTLPQRLHIPIALIGLINYPLDNSINLMALVLWLVIHPVNRAVNLQTMIIVERLDGYIPNND